MNLVDYNARICFTENEWRSPFSACVCVVLWWRCEWVERPYPSSDTFKLSR